MCSSTKACIVETPPRDRADEQANVIAQSVIRRLGLKYLSLVLLIMQNSGLFVAMKYSRIGHADEYSGTVAVLMVELLKLLMSFILYSDEANLGPSETCLKLWEQRSDLMVLAVPGLCYMGQQNFLFFAAKTLSAPALQIFGQTKTLWTAVFSTVMLGKRFTPLQIMSFLTLIGGVVLVQQQDSASDHESHESVILLPTLSNLSGWGNQTFVDSVMQASKPTPSESFELLLPLVACITAAALSGFAGVFLEKVYNRKGASLWALNVHLALISLPLQLVAILRFDRQLFSAGPFAGFHYDTWLVICIQAFGGLLTAVVIKYAGNILKAFATALAILTTCLLAMPLFDYEPTHLFWIGMVVVCIATVMYGTQPPSICLRPVGVGRAIPTGSMAVSLGELRVVPHDEAQCEVEGQSSAGSTSNRRCATDEATGSVEEGEVLRCVSV